MFTFDNVESAVRAKDTLNGADIYSGCCTLKIDFAKVSPFKLLVLVSWSLHISKMYLILLVTSIRIVGTLVRSLCAYDLTFK